MSCKKWDKGFMKCYSWHDQKMLSYKCCVAEWFNILSKRLFALPFHSETPTYLLFLQFGKCVFCFSHETYPFSICNLTDIISNIHNFFHRLHAFFHIPTFIALKFMWNYVLKFSVYNGILIHLSGGIYLVVRHGTLKEA